jgi:hypothetical protein
MHPKSGRIMAALVAALALCACKEQAGGPPVVAAAAKTAPAEVPADLTDRTLPPWQGDLLELAFRAVSAMPTEPHRKNRAMAQEKVVMACLQLDQHARALRMLEKIDGWQKGTCYAELAWHCVQYGNKAPVHLYLERATQLAEEALHEEAGQKWRRDRILAKVARTRLQLGETREAQELETGLTDSELGETAAAKASQLDAGAFDAQLQMLDQIFASANFDQIQGAMQMCVRLCDRFYADDQKRGQLVQRIESAYPKMPVPARLEFLIDTTRIAIAHGDRLEATALLDFAHGQLDRVNQLPEDRLPMLGRLAELRGRAGDVAGCRTAVSSALEFYHAKEATIFDVFRAQGLRPLAEALHAIADDAQALDVYRLAVEQGAHNPNSKPRAEDLAASCCSLAVQGCQPDARLHERLQQIQGNLGDPW